MKAQPFEEALMDHLNEKYPDEDTDDRQERFDVINNRRLYLIRHSGKTCPTCEAFKSFTEYGIDTRSTDGLHGTCRECRATPTPSHGTEGTPAP